MWGAPPNHLHGGGGGADTLPVLRLRHPPSPARRPGRSGLSELLTLPTTLQPSWGSALQMKDREASRPPRPPERIPIITPLVDVYLCLFYWLCSSGKPAKLGLCLRAGLFHSRGSGPMAGKSQACFPGHLAGPGLRTEFGVQGFFF